MACAEQAEAALVLARQATSTHHIIVKRDPVTGVCTTLPRVAGRAPWASFFNWKVGFGACPTKWSSEDTIAPRSSLFCFGKSETKGMCTGNVDSQGRRLEGDVVCPGMRVYVFLHESM